MLYHKDIGFPKDIKIVRTRLKLKWTAHGRKRKKLYNIQDKLNHVTITKGRVSEINVEDGKIVTMVCRFPYSTKENFILVIAPYITILKSKNVKCGRVVTCYLHDKEYSTKHPNKKRYEIP